VIEVTAATALETVSVDPPIVAVKLLPVVESAAVNERPAVSPEVSVVVAAEIFVVVVGGLVVPVMVEGAGSG
jgi:hypothetical protein